MKIAPLISLGVLCDDGCTITLDKKDIPVHKMDNKSLKAPETRKLEYGK